MKYLLTIEGNLGKYHLKQVIEYTSPSNSTRQQCVPPDIINLGEHSINFVVVLPKIYKLHIITGKYQKKM